MYCLSLAAAHHPADCICLCVLAQTALAQRNQELQVMVDQAASRPQTGNAGHTAPFMRVDLREETVTEHATPGTLVTLHFQLSNTALFNFQLCTFNYTFSTALSTPFNTQYQF